MCRGVLDRDERLSYRAGAAEHSVPPGAEPPNKRMQAGGRFSVTERRIVGESPQLMRGPLGRRQPDHENRRVIYTKSTTEG